MDKKDQADTGNQQKQDKIHTGHVKTTTSYININVEGVFADSVAIDFSQDHPELHFSVSTDDAHGIGQIHADWDTETERFAVPLPVSIT